MEQTVTEEGGSVRPDGSVRKTVRVRAGWSARREPRRYAPPAARDRDPSAQRSVAAITSYDASYDRSAPRSVAAMVRSEEDRAEHAVAGLSARLVWPGRGITGSDWVFATRCPPVPFSVHPDEHFIEHSAEHRSDDEDLGKKDGVARLPLDAGSTADELVSMHTYMHACVYVCMNACMCACVLYACMDVCTPLCVCMHTSMCIRVRARLRVCMFY